MATALPTCQFQDKKNKREYSYIKELVSVHSLAQCHGIGKASVLEFVYPAGFQPMSSWNIT